MPPWYGILTAAEIDPIWAYIRAMADRRRARFIHVPFTFGVLISGMHRKRA
jgi:hypothetical protein